MSILQFPQQKAWEDAQRLAEERRRQEETKEDKDVRTVTVACGYHGNFAYAYRHLISDPPSVFRVRFDRDKNGNWQKAGHFIANLDRMPILQAHIGDTRLQHQSFTIELMEDGAHETA